MVQNIIGSHYLKFLEVMNNILFDINNLKCQYPNAKYPALIIDSLKIYNSSITFFIGASGVGKSTVLETLGLMNNTFINQNDSVFNFHDPKNCNIPTIDLRNIWSKNENEIAEFRKQHLSFIFQTTNLFPTLSAYENVILTMVLQGKTKEEAIKTTRDIFSKIFSAGEIKNDKKITELSGGQRQRLAFARAVAVNYSVLFADEPTGNLDFANAHTLMKMLFSNVKNENKSAIIVSHDIFSAANFADKIVLIDKKYNDNDKYNYGYISDESCYIKDEKSIWYSNAGKSYSITEMNSYLNSKIEGQVANG